MAHRRKGKLPQPKTGRAARRAQGQRGLPSGGTPVAFKDLPLEMQLKFNAAQAQAAQRRTQEAENARVAEQQREELARRASAHARGFWLPGDDLPG